LTPSLFLLASHFFLQVGYRCPITKKTPSTVRIVPDPTFLLTSLARNRAENGAVITGADARIVEDCKELRHTITRIAYLKKKSK
jgi:hypothetical protein